MATTTAIFLFLFLGLPYLIAEYLRAIGSDWPATCTPFEGEAQRWTKERQLDAEIVPELGWGEVADLPPMNPETILRASDERFLEALDNQPDGDQIAPLRARKEPEGVDRETFETLNRSKRIRAAQEKRMAILKKAGLKLDVD